MAVDLSNTETEVFGGAVYMAYIHGDMFGTTGMQFYGVRPTEVVNVPVVRAGQAMFLDDGADHTNEDSSMTGVQVPLFKPLKSSNIIKQSQVDVRPDLSILENLGKQHGRNVARMKTITILQMLAKSSDLAGNDVAAPGAGWAGATGADIKAGVKDIAAAMDLAGVPAEGRHGMMKSDLWYELVDLEGVIRKDFGGKANVQTAGGNGAVINYLNFDIKNCGVGFGTNWDALGTSLDIPDAIQKDLTKSFAVFWHEDAWALRHQTSLHVVTPFIDHKQAWLCLARLHMGCAEVYTDPVIDDITTGGGLNTREGIYAFEGT